MATLRTEEEKSAIVAHCLELERTGGDILGYLLSENYLTPRATWCNFQREWLGRKPYQYTDGKPKKKKERKDMSKQVSTKDGRQKRLNELIERIKRGMGIRDALADMGYAGKSAGQTYRQIRVFAIANDPEAAKMLPVRISEEDAPVVKVENGMPKEQLQLDAGKNYEISVKDAMDNMQDAAGTFFGQCEEIGLKLDKAPITKPVSYDGLEVVAVRHPELGEFYYDKKFASIDWRTPEGDEVSLPPSLYVMLAHELPKILNVLGVAV